MEILKFKTWKRASEVFFLSIGLVMASSCQEEQLEQELSLFSASESVPVNVVITNSGFEDGWDGWESIGSSAISGIAYEGSSSAKLEEDDAEFYQTVSVTANTEYTLTAFVNGGWRIGVEFGETRKTRSGSTDEWKEESVTFSSGESTSVTIIGEYVNDEGRFDTFSLTTEAAVIEAPIEVVLTNPSFEEEWEGWTVVDPAAISGIANSGNSSAKLEDSDAEFAQIVSVSPNTDYVLSAYVLGGWKIGVEFDETRKTRSGVAADWM